MSSPGLQGLRPWMIQRLSAVYIGLYVVYVFICWIFNDPFNQANWLNWISQPVNNIALGLFLIAMLWHAWIGVRDIVLDYVPNVAFRLLVLSLLGATLIGSGLWGLRSLFMVVFK